MKSSLPSNTYWPELLSKSDAVVFLGTNIKYLDTMIQSVGLVPVCGKYLREELRQLPVKYRELQKQKVLTR